MPKEKAEKSLCMSGLRHAEYYGMQEVFDGLYAKSSKNETFTNLMNIILKRENILLAYRNIKSNDGSKTPGTDGVTFDDIGKLMPDEVIDTVRFITIGSTHGYVKHRYSEFLGFKMKVFRRADKYVIKSHVGDKQLEHARQKLVTQAKNIIHPRKEKHERGEISLYNSIVVGLQDYYRIATCISEDCSSLGRSVMTVLTNGLKERQGSRLVRNGRKLTVFESQKYGKSKSLRYAKGTDEPVYPISYIRHSIPLSRKRAINCYTPAGRKGLHDNLKINVNLMLALMRQPIGNRSVELADNRISLFSAQYGKCAVTGMPFLTTDEIHCHHIKPKKYGGNDSYENLVLINKLIHRLVHAETVETITYYLEVCNLNKKQMEKLNALRLKAGLGEIRGTQPLKTNKVDSNRL